MYFKKTPLTQVFIKAIVTLGLFFGILHTGLSQGVQIDDSFGEDGFFKFSFQHPIVICTGALIQKDDKIIISGFNYSDRQLLFIRITENGNIDSTYGENGMVTISRNTNLRIEDMNAVAQNEDGSIIAGLDCYPYDNYHPVEPTLIKLNKFGQIDSTFGENGFAKQFVSESNYMATLNDIFIQSDNSILFCGYFNDFWNSDINHFFIGRCLPNGSPDPNFGNNGIVTEYFDGSNCEAQVIFQQHDSKILLGGKLNNDFAVVRYNHFGMLDTTFANGGKFSTNVANAYQLNAIAELKDNTIILAGYGLYLGNQDCSPYYRNLLVGLTQDGVLSGDFSTSGYNQYLAGSCVSEANNLLIQSDNKILVGGSGGEPFGNGPYKLTLSRLDEHGILDESIGDDGYENFHSGLEKNNCVTLTLQSDGKIIMVGDASSEGHSYLIAMRADAGLIPPGHTLVEHEQAEIWSYDKTIYVTNTTTTEVNCHLFNALGQVLFSFTSPPGQSTYNLPELPDGWYVLSLNMPYGLVTHKLLFTN